jgi:GTP cyclohydrolase I
MEACKINEKMVSFHLREMMIKGLGLDLSDPNLKDTPDRIARAYCREFFAGLNEDKLPKVTTFPNKDNYNEIIMLDNIPFISMCSHHFLPFQGLAWFLYIPKRKLIGASKINRIIQYFAAKPQIQEKLSKEIMDFFIKKMDPLGAMLIMRAVHGCMSCRGVRQGLEGGMVTSAVYGSFHDNIITRNEGLDLIKLSRK